MDSQFTVLMVCTGNVCRSPLAELFLKKSMPGDESIAVSSAGTRALSDSPMDPTSMKMAGDLGIVEGIAEHRGRQLDSATAEGADLILTMTRSQRRKVVELAPRTTKRVFTLREFARLVEATTDSDLRDEIGTGKDSTLKRLKAGVRAAALTRSDIEAPVNPADDEVVDPYRQPIAVYEESTQQIVPAIMSISHYFRHVLEVAVP